MDKCYIFRTKTSQLLVWERIPQPDKTIEVVNYNFPDDADRVFPDTKVT